MSPRVCAAAGASRLESGSSIRNTCGSRTEFRGGPVGIDTIAASIGEESVTIEDVYEPYLLQIGFIQRTPRGRVVTNYGYEHFGYDLPEQPNN